MKYTYTFSTDLGKHKLSNNSDSFTNIETNPGNSLSNPQHMIQCNLLGVIDWVINNV